MSTRWTRVARGTLAALLSTFVAAFSHVAAGGGPPSSAALSLAVAFSTIVCVALAGRRLSYWRIGLSVAASQLFFHTLFSLIAAPTTDVRGAGTGAHHAHDMAAMLQPTTGGSPSVGAIAVDVAMISGHLMAAVVTFAAIVWGERAVRGALASALLHLGRFAALLPAPVFVTRPVRLGSVRRVDAPAVLELLLASLWHRGPPALA